MGTKKLVMSGLTGHVLDPPILLELNPPHFYMVILVPILVGPPGLLLVLVHGQYWLL